MTQFAHVMQRLFNAPLMIQPQKAEMLVAALAERIGIARLERLDGSALDSQAMGEMAAAGRSGNRIERRVYDMIDGVAWIPVSGTLVHKLGSVDPYSGMTGYDGIALKLREASMDDDVRAIWLDFDSPGGEVSGCFDLVDEIAARGKAAGGKPIWAFVNESAYSAAYALASAADKIFAPRTAGVGSIGVYMLHVELTKALAEGGITVDMIRSGSNKAKGGPYEVMEDATRARFQASVDESRDLFARTVAKNRRMSVASVMATEGEWYGAADGLKLGLIDGVMSEVEAFAKLQRSIARQN